MTTAALNPTLTPSAGGAAQSAPQTRDRSALFLLAALLILSGVVQAQNMFRFPYYQDAEGTVMSNAWASGTLGLLSPYTYAYEEPPAGSLLLGVWTTLSGGYDAFGFSINSGRVVMLVAHLLCVAFLFGITRKMTGNNLAAVVATLVFAFSPLVTLLQRRVLLDNLMLVFLLGSVYLITGERRTIAHYILSAFAFGLAVLTKGAAIFFLPALWFAIRANADAYHRRFATGLWAALTLFTIAFYPLYAQMKQELFPQGWLLGGDFPHVSLVERIADRGLDSGRFLNVGAGFPESFDLWTNIDNEGADPILVYGGLVALLFVALMALDNRRLRPVVILALGFGVYLLFGGQVFNSHILLLVPALAIAVGVVVGALAKLVSGAIPNVVLRFGVATLVVAVLLYPFWIFYSNRVEVYTLDQVSGQIEAVEWIAQNVPADAVVVTDNYAFLELRQSHPNTHHYWKVDTDPDIKFTTLNDDWCSIDYLISTPQVYADITTYNMDLMLRTFNNSELLITYPNNGWPVEVRQVNKQFCNPLATADAETSPDLPVSPQ